MILSEFQSEKLPIVESIEQKPMSSQLCSAGLGFSTDRCIELQEDLSPLDNSLNSSLSDHENPYFDQKLQKPMTLVTFEPEGFQTLIVISKQLRSASCSYNAGDDQLKSSTDLIFLEDQNTADCSPNGIVRSKPKTLADLGNEQPDVQDTSTASRRSRRSASLELLCHQKRPAASIEAPPRANSPRASVPSPEEQPQADQQQRTPTWDTQPRTCPPLCMSSAVCIPPAPAADGLSSPRKLPGLALLRGLDGTGTQTINTPPDSSADTHTRKPFVFKEQERLDQATQACPNQEQPALIQEVNIFFDHEEQPSSSHGKLQQASTSKIVTRFGSKSESKSKMSSIGDNSSVLSKSSESGSAFQIKLRMNGEVISSRTEKRSDQCPDTSFVMDQSPECRPRNVCRSTSKRQNKRTASSSVATSPLFKDEAKHICLSPVNPTHLPALLSKPSGHNSGSTQKNIKARLNGLMMSQDSQILSEKRNTVSVSESTPNRNILIILLVALGIGLVASEPFWG